MLPDFAAEGMRCLPAAACPRFQAKLTTFGLAGGIGYLRAISAEQLQREKSFAESGSLDRIPLLHTGRVPSILDVVKALCGEALQIAFPGVEVPVIVTQSTNAKFGDYQCNNAMSLFAKLKGKVCPSMYSCNAPALPQSVASRADPCSGIWADAQPTCNFWTAPCALIGFLTIVHPGGPGTAAGAKPWLTCRRRTHSTACTRLVDVSSPSTKRRNSKSGALLWVPSCPGDCVA